MPMRSERQAALLGGLDCGPSPRAHVRVTILQHIRGFTTVGGEE